MTALDCANALLKNRSAKLALTVILLGIFAVSAAQAVVLSNNLCAAASPTSCVFSSGLSFSVTDLSTGLPISSGAVPTGGVFGASPDAAGGVVLVGGFGLTADVAGDYNFLLDLTGPGAGVPLGTNFVFASYDVTIASSGTSGILGALATFSVTQNGNTTALSFPVLGQGEQVGHGNVGPLDPSLAVTNWDMQFSFDWLANAGDTLAVDFPLSEDPTPEPVSVLLVGSGIGLLALLRRYRKA